MIPILKSKKTALLIILLLVVIRAFIYHRFYINREVYLASDNAVYAILSKRFLQGDLLKAFNPYWSPGFPLATIPFYFLSGSWEQAQYLVSVASVIILIPMMFWFFGRFSLILGISVAFIAAFSPGLQKTVNSEGITEPLYIFLLWVAILSGYLAISKKSRTKKYSIISGLFFGLSYLTRTEVMIIFLSFMGIITLLELWYNFIKNKKRNIRNSVNNLIIKLSPIVIVFLLVNMPYVVAQSIQLGKFTFSGKYAYIGSGPYYAIEKTRPATWAQEVWSVDFPNYKSPYYDSKRATKSLLKVVKNGTFSYFGKKGFKGIIQLYRSENTDNFFLGISLPITILGFFITLFDKKYRWLTLYLGTLFISGILWVSFFMAPHYRYLVFAFPFFFYLQSAGIVIISKKLMNRFSIILVLITLGIYFMQNVKIKSWLNPGKISRHDDHKMIGEWIKSQNIDLIGARYEAIPYYADAKEVYMPSETPETVISYMKDWGVEYLMVRPNEMGSYLVKPIADPTYKNSDLTLLHTFPDGSLIWKIRLTDEERRINQRTMLGY